MQHLLDADDKLISAEELLKIIKKAKRDYKKGKVYKLKSLAKLM